MMPQLREWLPGGGDAWSAATDSNGCLPCVRTYRDSDGSALLYSFRSDETTTHHADLRDHAIAAVARECLARTIPPYVALARLAEILGQRIDGMTPQMFLLRMEVGRDD